MEESNQFRKYKTKSYQAHSKQIYCLDWNCNGKYLASADNCIKIWKYKKGVGLTFDKEIKAHTDQIESMQYNPNERYKYLICTCSRNSIKLWDTREPKSQSNIRTKSSNTYLTWSPDGSTIAVGNKENIITIYQAEDFKPKQEIKIKEGELQEFMWDHKEGSVLFVAVCQKNIGYVQIYDGKNPTEKLHQLECHRAMINTIIGDPQGKYFATGGNDALVAIWNLYEMICIQTYSGLTEVIQKLSFSKDSKYIATASQNEFIDIINTESGTLNYRIEDCKGGQNIVKWHPSENELVYVAVKDKKQDNYNITLFYQQ